MPPEDKSLRILVIVNLPWDSRLGASRVWMELAEQWRAAGHSVEKFSLSDAFRDARATRVKFALRQLLFPRRAAAFIRQNADRFDVIDALIGTLPYSKRELRFRGLLVARSVGLYLLYQRFEESVGRRWPHRPPGKLIGRLLYRFTNRRLSAASDRAMREADLINVPNEEEAECVRHELGGKPRIIVQPYGLTAERQRALAAAAAAPESRLAQKRICFIGMWGARKGAYDWPRLIEHVRREIPAAKFRLLGTMINDEAVRRDLGLNNADGIELISAYAPDELPTLLSDCAVGAFPSYVEGFGLAVIEQLAAGVPTVAYDTVGPRDILKPRLPELLVRNGDVMELAAAICRLLRYSATEYKALSERCAAIEFSWPEIANDTLKEYRQAIRETTEPIVFVQPFSIGSAGGGARILRALLEHAPFAWHSVCSSPDKPKLRRGETHLPSRPSWGRVEHSRLAWLPQHTARVFASQFRRNLRECCVALKARAIHAVPHSGLDFSIAQTVARDLSLPFFLSLHDDLAYTALGAVAPGACEAAMRAAWQDASARFVISDSLGREYCRRYGDRTCQVVTDGLTELQAPRGGPGIENCFRIYFMGLFHMPYERNLRALLDALVILKRAHPSAEISVTLRCEHVKAQVLAGEIPVQVLPFADEAQVQRDIAEADLLYMPLHFGEEHENFARYSLSTKMVTYIGGGVPILYHGPSSSAAFELLSKHRAAILMPTLVPEEIARALKSADRSTRAEITHNALELARRSFMLADQTDRFWRTISDELTHV